MNGKQRDRVATLERRRDHLADRLAKWSRGDPSRTRAELGALNWALAVVRGAEHNGILTDLERW